jgi:hypothetical protein
MAKALITCDTLGDLDQNAARLIIDAALRDAINDLEDRGQQDRKPRRVNIVVTFNLLDNGQVSATVEALAKVPMRKTASTIGEITRQGRNMQIMFSQHSPDNPDQLTVNDVLEQQTGVTP